MIEKGSAFSWTLPPVAAAACQFNEQLAQRYAPQSLIASSAHLALEWAQAAQTNFFREDLHFDYSPSFTFQASHSGLDSKSAVPGKEEFGVKQAGILFERLFRSRQRRSAFDAMAAPANPLSTSTSPAALPIKVERVLPKRPVALEATARKPVSERAEDLTPATVAGWGTPVNLPSAPQTFTLPPPEVRRVADRVLREMDRRLTASRERMGRR